MVAHENTAYLRKGQPLLQSQRNRPIFPPPRLSRLIIFQTNKCIQNLKTAMIMNTHSSGVDQMQGVNRNRVKYCVKKTIIWILTSVKTHILRPFPSKLVQDRFLLIHHWKRRAKKQCQPPPLPRKVEL